MIARWARTAHSDYGGSDCASPCLPVTLSRYRFPPPPMPFHPACAIENRCHYDAHTHTQCKAITLESPLRLARSRDERIFLQFRHLGDRSSHVGDLPANNIFAYGLYMQSFTSLIVAISAQPLTLIVPRTRNKKAVYRAELMDRSNEVGTQSVSGHGTTLAGFSAVLFGKRRDILFAISIKYK